MYDNKYPEPTCTAELQQKESRIPTTRERLQLAKKELTKRLNDVNAALEALDKFPEFENIHNLLTKAGC